MMALEWVNKLKDSSSASQRGNSYRKISLDSAVQMAIPEIQPLLDRTKGKIETGYLPEVEADSAQMYMLFKSTMAQIIQSWDSHQRILIRVEGYPGTQGYWHIFIRSKALPNAVSNGSQSDAKQEAPQKRKTSFSKNFMLCEQIIKEHNGKFSVLNQPGGGLSFFISLPEKL